MIEPLSRRHKAILYVLVPATVTIALMACYFSGVQVLQSLVSPAYNREFGLLESLQHLILLVLIVILVRGLRNRTSRLEQRVLGIALAGTILMLLEEVDYGLHLLDVMHDRRPDYEQMRNLHNLRSTKRLKQLSDIVMVLYFAVLPLVAPRVRQPWLRQLAPDRICILTLIVTGVLTNTATWIQDTTLQVGSISKNISEFTELNHYYLVAAYFYELTVHRPPPVPASAA